MLPTQTELQTELSTCFKSALNTLSTQTELGNELKLSLQRALHLLQTELSTELSLSFTELYTCFNELKLSFKLSFRRALKVP